MIYEWEVYPCTDVDTDTSSDTDTVTDCDTDYEVEHLGRCYYLDGSRGVCDPGYELGPQSVLYTIGPSFEDRDYRYSVSSNCCIYNSEPDEDFGMADHCNMPGPFSATDVQEGAMGCTNMTNLYENQLTLCRTAGDVDTDTETDTGTDTGPDPDPLVVTFWEQMWYGANYNQHRLLIGPGSSLNPEDTATWTVLADGAAMDNPLWDSSYDWVQGYVADISAWAGDSVRFAWHYFGDGSDDKWYIDDACMGWGDGVDDVPTTCLWEDSMEDPGYPNIPTGWTSVEGSSNDSSSNDWRTSSDQWHTGATSALVDGSPSAWTCDRYLVSPQITLPTE
jgi:hypothetical protein